jgi:hypothetical protein
MENGNLGSMLQLLEILRDGIIKDYYISDNLDRFYLLYSKL